MKKIVIIILVLFCLGCTTQEGGEGISVSGTAPDLRGPLSGVIPQGGAFGDMIQEGNPADQFGEGSAAPFGSGGMNAFGSGGFGIASPSESEGEKKLPPAKAPPVSTRAPASQGSKSAPTEQLVESQKEVCGGCWSYTLARHRFDGNGCTPKGAAPEPGDEFQCNQQGQWVPAGSAVFDPNIRRPKAEF